MRKDFVEFFANYIGWIPANLLVPFYVELVVGGMLLASFLGFRRLRKQGVDIEPYLSAAAVGYLGMFAGGRLVWLVFNASEYVSGQRSVWRFWEGGFSTFGAFSGAVLASFCYLYLRRLPLLVFSDAMAPFVGLLVCLARLGCFMNGCCHGLPSDSLWGISFPQNTMAYRAHVHAGLVSVGDARSLPVHPTQLLESALGLAIFLLLLGKMQNKIPGWKTWLFVLIYGVGRFVIEIFRGDYRPYLFSWFSLAHAAALLMVVTGAFSLWYIHRTTLELAEKAVKEQGAHAN